MRPGDMITIEPVSEYGSGCRYGWHWSMDFNKMAPVNELADALIKLEMRGVYVVLSSVNDKFSTRWTLITNGNILAWQRDVYMRKA